jgi:hypothetical protein
MTVQSKQSALCRWLCDELKQGIVLTTDVRNYLDATFGSDDLAGVLAAADNSETDSLLDLLFYPDTALRLRFEMQWGQERFSDHDREAVIDMLRAASPWARVTLPGTNRKLPIAVPAFALQAFVQRLNICWQPCTQMADALNAWGPDEKGLRARVQLRNARLAWHANQVALVCRFLSHVEALSQTTDTDLAFLIAILSELVPGQDQYEFLVGKKFFYFQSLCRAEDFERKRQASNMEIMMMAGARSAHGSIDEWRHNMRRIDRICQALFGRTQFFQHPDSQSIDLPNSRSPDGLQNVVRILS